MDETIEDKKQKLSIFDFDGTLMDTPIPEEGKERWKEVTGEEWPYKGWWGRSGSLDMNVFDIQPIEEVVDRYKEEYNDPQTVTVMMTGRHEGLREDVMTILNAFDLEFDHYLLKKKSPTIKDKLEKLESLLSKYPNINKVEIWEDRANHVEHFKEWGANKDQVVVVNHIA